MSNNVNLNKAKKTKNDEFYTSLDDITNELEYYKDYLKDKIIYCNCDDMKSMFWKYFFTNFETLGLRLLICTSYKEGGKGNKITYDGNKILECELNSNGDFRSEECLDILKQCDMVITNPPFSLYREFLALLIKYNKQFLIIGTKNSALCRDTFPLLAEQKIWFGRTTPDNFTTPEGPTDKLKGTCRWFTNIGELYIKDLPLKKRYYDYYDEHGNLKEGCEDKYPKFDDYSMINVSKVADIPCDYYGIMGVPITYIEKFNKDEFDIGTFRWLDDVSDKMGFFTLEKQKEYNNIDEEFPPCITNRTAGLMTGFINGKETYIRIMIKRKMK